jgi:hypothetical protein
MSEYNLDNDFSSGFLKNALKTEIWQKLINQKANACPMAMRVAWHSSGTYDASDSSGGSDGATMRFEPEASDGANAGLHIIHDLLIPVKQTFPNVSTADIWAMSGAVAVEFAGGPSIPFELGRTDAPSAEEAKVPPNGRLPDALQGAAHLREVFGRMGFDDQGIVALSGGHTLGRCHKVRSGFDGAWTENPLKFDNSYYVNLMTKEWIKREWDGPLQYTDAETKTLTMLETDIALKTDDAFRPIAQKYADDETAFFTDFKEAYGKLLALGCPAAAQPNKPPAACPHATEAYSAEFRDHAMHGSIEHCKNAVEKGADIHSREKNSGRTALHKASYWNHIHMMDWMLKELKIDPNVQDYNGDIALHDAAMFGHVDVAQALIAAGSDKSIKNRDGRTPLDVAVAYEKPALAALLRTEGGNLPGSVN